MAVRLAEPDRSKVFFCWTCGGGFDQFSAKRAWRGLSPCCGGYAIRVKFNGGGYTVRVKL